MCECVNVHNSTHHRTAAAQSSSHPQSRSTPKGKSATTPANISTISLAFTIAFHGCTRNRTQTNTHTHTSFAHHHSRRTLGAPHTHTIYTLRSTTYAGAVATVSAQFRILCVCARTFVCRSSDYHNIYHECVNICVCVRVCVLAFIPIKVCVRARREPFSPVRSVVRTPLICTTGNSRARALECAFHSGMTCIIFIE